MREQWDVIVVGSGAAGGWAAKELAAHGLHVLILEAGAPAESAGAPGNSRQPVQSKCYAFDRSTRSTFVDDVDNPYTTPAGAPFEWIRARAVGGRMLLWDRVCLRMSDVDMAGWPITYADLAPYYEEVERFIGVCGTNAGLAAIPDGTFIAPPALGPLATHLCDAVERRVPQRRLTTTRRATRGHEETLAAALATPRVTLRPNAVVSRVLTDPVSGEATGVAFVDRLSRRNDQAHARAVVVCTSAIESARLLLNSRSARHPNGLANSSGTVGRYLMDHVFLTMQLRCAVPAGLQPTTDEISSCYLAPAAHDGYRFGVVLTLRNAAGALGARLRTAAADVYHDRRTLRRLLGAGAMCEVDLAAIGASAAHAENRVTVRDELRDAWGIPVAHIAYQRTPAERAAAHAMQTEARAAVAAGFEVVRARAALYPPGLSVHESGTVRMGSDAARAPLNSFNQAWDCANLFVTDGACFPAGGFQNPTLTIMAVSLRASRYLARQSNLF
jgi:choline dehydrogenase-like flavoprotein